MLRTVAMFLVFLVSSGCAMQRVNPTFSISTADARADWRRMCSAPLPPGRMVVVVGGYADPGVAAFDVASRLRRVLGPEASIVSVQVGLSFSMDGARRHLLEQVHRAEAASGLSEETPVDVVAVSMGGLVARYAAVPHPMGGGKSDWLRIARLFTIASPHTGARMADVPSIESRVREMRRDSGFIAELAREPRDYELLPYARLGDWVVGEENTAPNGLIPWWVDTPMFEASHLQAHTDVRILVDIARRLRGEEPVTRSPAAPLPEKS